MNIRVLADGADGYRLLNPDDGIVGWVRGRVVGVAGFTDQPSTIMAALNAFRRLAAWQEGEKGRPLPSIDGLTVSVVHDGAYTWLAAGHVPVARLIRRATNDFATSAEHAFEILLHGRVSDGTAIRAALIAVETLTGGNDSADITWPASKSGPVAAVTRLNLDAPLM
jgi:hypothetical protein